MRDWAQVAVARDLYRQCVEEDPAFAPAWAKLGRCHRLLAKYHLERPAENLALADEAFRRALELDPELPLAHKVYAHHEAEQGRARDAMVRLLGLARRNRNDAETFARAGARLPLLRPARGVAGRARRGAPARPARLDQRHLHPVGASATTRASSRSPRTPATSSCAAWRCTRPAAATRPGALLDEALAAPAPADGRHVRATRFAGVLDGDAAALGGLAEIVEAHADPEALYMYGSWQVLAGRPGRGARDAARAPVDGGYAVPQALAHPWLEPLRGAPLAGLVARAEAGRQQAEQAFRDAGGPSLLGL